MAVYAPAGEPARTRLDGARRGARGDRLSVPVGRPEAVRLDARKLEPGGPRRRPLPRHLALRRPRDVRPARRAAVVAARRLLGRTRPGPNAAGELGPRRLRPGRRPRRGDVPRDADEVADAGPVRR